MSAKDPKTGKLRDHGLEAIKKAVREVVGGTTNDYLLQVVDDEGNTLLSEILAAILAGGSNTQPVNLNFEVEAVDVDTEIEVTLPQDTKGFYIQNRRGDVIMRLSYEENGTSDAADSYTTIHKGGIFQDFNFYENQNQKIYLRADKASKVEVQAYTVA